MLMSRAVRKAAGVLICALVLASGEPTQGQNCVGDCDDDGRVLVSELILGVEIALGVLPESRCEAFDPDDSGAVAIDELLFGVRDSLGPCALATQTPSPTGGTATPTSTPPSGGGLVREGNEFRINQDNDEDEECPSVARTADGGFLVAWEQGVSLGEVALGILARRFDSSGMPAADEFDVTDDTGTSEPNVATDAAGNSLVVWRDTTQADIRGRFFDPDGEPIGNDFRIEDFGVSPAIGKAAGGTEGRFLVAWSDLGVDDSGLGIVGQLVEVGEEPNSDFLINSYTGGDQSEPFVAGNDSGQFLVVWTGYDDSDGDAAGIFAQRLGSGGQRLGRELQVNSYTRDDQSRPNAAFLSDGGFVIVWAGSRRDGANGGIFAQRFSSAGARAGTEFQVNTYTIGDQDTPVVVPAGGGFVVAWESEEGSGGDAQDGSEGGIFAQRFGSNGVPIGTEFQVNSYTRDDQGPLAAAATEDGELVIVWESDGQDDHGEGVFGQRFRIAP
jgi:hypothetical protein